MSYQFSPDLERLVHQRMSAGDYKTEDELLLDAMLALEDIERRGIELRSDIRKRMESAETKDSRPLDRSAFKADARNRLGRSS